MAADLEAHVTQILSDLRAAHTHYTLADHQVRISEDTRPWVSGLACVSLWWTSIRSEYADMRRRFRAVSVSVWGWAPVTALAEAARATAGQRLADDVMAAIETSHRDSGSSIHGVSDLNIEVDVFDGGATGLAPGYAVFTGELTYRYLVEVGL